MPRSIDSNTTAEKNQPLVIDYCNNTVIKEMKSLPEVVRDQFLMNLELLSVGLDLEIPIDHLSEIEPGVIELKINGSPAYRLVYSTKFTGKLVVLAARPKTTEGRDKKLIEAVTSRLKAYRRK